MKQFKRDHERMPGITPWTVSVAILPGDSPCLELEALDLALRKKREPQPEDELLKAWKKKIAWPKRGDYGKPIYLKIFPVVVTQRMLDFHNWTDWLIQKARMDFNASDKLLGRK